MKVFNRLAYFSLVLIVFSVAPALAAGNLTVTNGTLSSLSSSGDFWNTGMNVILNITFYSRISDVNVTGLLVNITGSLNASNITGIFVYNDSDSDAIIDPSEIALGSNTSLNNTFNYSFILFSTVLSVPNHTNRSVLIAFNISRSAFRFNTTGAYLSGGANVNTSNLEVSDNVTLALGTINSSVKMILDMHANATISPRVVDTNVTEQMFVYTIAPTSQNTTDRMKIVIPVGYTLLNVTDVYVGTVRYTRNFAGSNGSEIVGVTLGITEFNLTFTTPGPANPIKINFTLNTNLSAQNSVAFETKIFGNGLNFVNLDVYSEATNVTTTQVMQVLSVGGNKTAALVNGTDYWEFTLRLNFTANVSGSIQFRMNNWTSSAGTITLTNGTQFYASIRNDSTITNSTRIANITNDYNTTQVIPFNVTSDATTENTVTKVKHLVLRMTIPSSTSVSTGWYNVYSLLFRSNPT